MRWFSPFFLFAVAALLVVGTFADDPKPTPDASLAAAEQLYRSGKLPEAEASYRDLLKTMPQVIAAQVGLVRVLLREQKIDDALDSVNSDLGAQPNSAALLAAKGEVLFRRGEMQDAELAFLAARQADPREVHADLGLARLYRAYSLYRKAYDLLEEAHRLAPADIDVQRAWLGMLPRKERIAALEAYLDAPHPDDPDETRGLQDMLMFLKATADQPVHACRLASKVERTTTKLEMMLMDARRLRGIGLTVQLNDHKLRLLLDTGAGGITIGSKAAEKAGLKRIAAEHFGGIGDKGIQSGYTAVADHIKIGELEFDDCVVSVSDKHSVGDEDGLIGADVFGAYLVDLDLPGMRLNLSPLPKRPDDTVAPTALNSEGEDQANAERKETADADSAKNALPAQPRAARLPRDRYVAPEMANFTKVFRFGHSLLIPTLVNDSKPMMFILDTGASVNLLSVRAGKLVTKVSSDSTVRIKGLSGEVNNVYSSDRATLQFGNLRQPLRNLISIDMSEPSRHLGTEISGFLGFTTLHLLDVKLDYRDGLVDFTYDPNRVPIGLR